MAPALKCDVNRFRQQKCGRVITCLWGSWLSFSHLRMGQLMYFSAPSANPAFRESKVMALQSHQVWPPFRYSVASVIPNFSQFQLSWSRLSRPCISAPLLCARPCGTSSATSSRSKRRSMRRTGTRGRGSLGPRPCWAVHEESHYIWWFCWEMLGKSPIANRAVATTQWLDD